MCLVEINISYVGFKMIWQHVMDSGHQTVFSGSKLKIVLLITQKRIEIERNFDMQNVQHNTIYKKGLGQRSRSQEKTHKTLPPIYLWTLKAMNNINKTCLIIMFYPYVWPFFFVSKTAINKKKRKAVVIDHWQLTFNLNYFLIFLYSLLF